METLPLAQLQNRALALRHLCDGLQSELRRHQPKDRGHLAVAIAHLESAELLLAHVRSAIECEREDQIAKAGRVVDRMLDAVTQANATPECGHSACRQNWIDTGETACVEGSVGLLTDADRAQAEEAANRG